MWQLRITVLRDEPTTELLNEYASNGYCVYRDTETDLFFLKDGMIESDSFDDFGSEYLRVLDIPFKYDWSYLKAFKADHKELLKHTFIHDEIFLDALALSQTFSTRVLCVYSNDEGCDFTVIAENGKLLRLRFKAGQKQGKRVDDDVAEQIKTEIYARRVLMDGEDTEDDGVFEYTAYEALQTKDQPLTLHPYWNYREGDIGQQGIFDTISSKPKGTEGNLMFRNAFLEFEEAFGKPPPDFSDIPEENRFQRIAFQAPPKTSTITKTFNFVTSILGLMVNSRKAMIWSVGIMFVLAAVLFGGDNERPDKQKTFAQNCVTAGGAISGSFNDECKIDDITYRNWSLPGEKGERRIMFLKIGSEQIPCTRAAPRQCLLVNGELFYDHIEGFTFSPGKEQIVPVERIQTCDPETLNDCSQENGIFQFKQL